MRSLFASLLLLLAFGLTGQGASRVLIGLEGEPLAPEAATALANELATHAGRVIHRYALVNVVLAELPEEAIAELAESPAVRFIERDGEVAAPEPAGAQELKLTWEWLPWGVERIGADKVHHPPERASAALLLFLPLLGFSLGLARLRRAGLALLLALSLALLLFGCEPPYIRIRPNSQGYAGAGVRVALLDSGIDPEHPDLRGSYIGGYDFVNGDSEPWDDNGHGTEVAGILAARENGTGVVGVAPQAELLVVKILGQDARGAISDVIRGLEWAVQRGAEVVNLSLGTPEDSPALREAVRAAWEAGLVLVAAAGNESGSVLYPAAYPEVLAVSGIDRKDRLVWSSNFGPEVDLAAPGEELPTSYPRGRYRLATGTSFAAAHVTGTVALLISSGIRENRAIRARLEGTAEDLGLPRQQQGAGLVDAARAVLGEPAEAR
ncbi:MAG: S8 family peptidase [Candidatus Acetothermia bacterium]|jgi:subtilisin family serine protease|nr:S8 family peptidase [Candidatus Acetothermia bacterium]MDH7504851.1 S8 family peptidase [Candidatus Acetothermia bacterium]